MSDKQLDMIRKILEELQSEIVEKKKEYYELAKQLPLKIIPNYVFLDIDNHEKMLSELFGDKEELIIVHNMGRNCPYCTMWADGFNGVLSHLESRASFVVVTPDEPEIMKHLSIERNWRFRIYSSSKNSMKTDLGFEKEDGELIPGVSTFRKNEKHEIILTASTLFGPGDDFCSVWYFFDLLYKKDENWTPKLSY